MNQDNLKGKGQDLKGKIKEGVGDVTNDRDLKNEGLIDQGRGKAQDAWGTVKDKAHEIKEDVKDVVRDRDREDDRIDRDRDRDKDRVA